MFSALNCKVVNWLICRGSLMEKYIKTWDILWKLTPQTLQVTDPVRQVG